MLEKLKVGENFRIYNALGHSISENELYFLNHDGKPFAIVYVSNQSKCCSLLSLTLDDYFDFDFYIKMFRSIKKLGEGGFGVVHLGQHKITTEQFAIKFIMPP